MKPSNMRSWLRWLGLSGGLVLLLWAMARAGRELPPWAVLAQRWPEAGAMLALAAGNLLITGMLFWSVTRIFDPAPPVRRRTMIALIAGSALVNYLPLGWPGPAARSAYLKLRHHLPVWQSLLGLGIVLTLTVLLAGGALALRALSQPTARLAGAVAGLVFLSLATRQLAPLLLRRKTVGAWTWLPLKALDLALSGGRLWLAFRIAGVEVAWWDALVLASIDMLVTMLAFTPNGLGLSEWAVGLLAQMLAISSSPAGQLAKLIDRGVGVLVIVPAGLWALRVLWRPLGPVASANSAPCD